MAETEIGSREDDEQNIGDVACCVFNPSDNYYDRSTGCVLIGCLHTIVGVLMLIVFIIQRILMIYFHIGLKISLKYDTLFLLFVFYMSTGLLSCFVATLCEYDFPWLSRLMRRIFRNKEAMPAQIYPTLP